MTLPVVLKGMASSIPPLRSLGKIAFGGSQVLIGSNPATQMGAFPSCPNAHLSCSSGSPVTDMCCFNAPGGQFSLTQFWNSDPSKSRFDYLGPEDSFTIHGLWPDHCDGTYDKNCDRERFYPAIIPILESFGKDSLLSYMQKNWKGINGDEHLYTHEWENHGTCVNTIQPECYDDYQTSQEVVDYFERAVELHKQLPTYQWLEAAGILPSEDITYRLDDLHAALESKHGHPVVIACEHNELREIWYNFAVLGSVAGGKFVPSDPDWSGVPGRKQPEDRRKRCELSGVKYLPKGNTDPTPTHTRHSATRTGTSTIATGTSAPFSGRGFLNGHLFSGNTLGCIIGTGKWYSTGSCATFRATAAGDEFTLASNKGKCAIVDNAFVCSSAISDASVFTSINGKVAFEGQSSFFADDLPSGTQQEVVYTTGEHSVTFEITWQSV